MKRKTLTVLLLLVSLWGGAFASHYSPEWMELPILGTAILLGMVGLFISCPD